MIIVRAPLRITLGGGGTDVKSYYEKHEGLCIAAAINKYVFITLHETFVDYLILKYSELEEVTDLAQISHRIIREVMRSFGVKPSGLEMTSMADIPAGTGLGSSSAFTVALIKALQVYNDHDYNMSTEMLAESACEIEIETLHEPIGKQDQYISAFGGLRYLHFGQSGRVDAWPSHMPNSTRHDLEDGLMLFFTGYQRSASAVLSAPASNVEGNLGRIHEVALRTREALDCGDLDTFGGLLSTQWELKRQRIPAATNNDIDSWYEVGLHGGASGGKLIGAGGGGFLLFFTENRRRLRKAMRETGLPEVRFNVDNEGARVVLQ